MARQFLRFDVEDVALYLSCAVKSLRILRQELETDLLNSKKYAIPPDYAIECCDAMSPALNELERIKEELDNIVHEMYCKKEVCSE